MKSNPDFKMTKRKRIKTTFFTTFTVLMTLLMAEGASASTDLSSISMSPNAAVSGQTVTGTVRMSERCPSSGCNVSLKSSNSAIAAVPASLFIPSGSSSKSFTFVAGNVSAKSVVTISAIYAGRTRTTGTYFSISPSSSTSTPPPTTTAPSISVIATPGAAVSGGLVLVQFRLSSNCTTPGGCIVKMSSSHPALTPMPAAVELSSVCSTVIPCQLANFGFTAGQVTVPTTVTVTASLDGSSGSASFTIYPFTAPAKSALIYLPPPIVATGQIAGMEISRRHIIGGNMNEFTIKMKATSDNDRIISLVSSRPDLVTVQASSIINAYWNSSYRIYLSTKAVSSVTVVKMTATMSDGSKADGYFSLSPSLPAASPALNKTFIPYEHFPNFAYHSASLYHLDVCFSYLYLNECSSPDISVKELDLDSGYPAWSYKLDFSMHGTFQQTMQANCLTCPPAQGVDYVNVFGGSAMDPDTSYSDYLQEVNQAYHTCRYKAAYAKATSYTWQPVPVALGGRFKGYVIQNSSSGMTGYAYGRQYMCSWQ